jgi:hypothetical protein
VSGCGKGFSYVNNFTANEKHPRVIAVWLNQVMDRSVACKRQVALDVLHVRPQAMIAVVDPLYMLWVCGRDSLDVYVIPLLTRSQVRSTFVC